MIRGMRSVRRSLLTTAACLGGTALGATLLPSPAAAAVRLVQVGTASQPTALSATPQDPTRLYVAQQDGVIKVLRAGQSTTFLDISARMTAADGGLGERGLLGLAFAPDFATSGRLYVYFTARGTNALTIARYTASSPDRADEATFEALLSIPHDRQSNHNGGQLQFGPDGMLYAATGDGGSGGDPSGNGQGLTSAPTVVAGVNHDARLGKLLRLDVSSVKGYTQPAGNPFPAPARDVWAYGLRNPFRFSFDRQTGDLTIGDVGQDAYEEIDVVAGTGRARNFGWNRYEGAHTYPGGNPVSSASGFTFPALEQSHADGWCSITGGYVVRDPALGDLLGRYVYTDFCKGELRSARSAGGGTLTGDAPVPGVPAVQRVSTFGEDASGRVYLASLTGPVYRLEAVAGSGGVLAPEADRTAPAVSLTRTRTQHPLRTGRVTVNPRCSEACELRVKGRIFVGGKRRVGGLRTDSRALEADVRAKLTARLTKYGAGIIAPALRRGQRVVVRLTIRATDAAGNTSSRDQVVRIRR